MNSSYNNPAATFFSGRNEILALIYIRTCIHPVPGFIYTAADAICLPIYRERMEYT